VFQFEGVRECGAGYCRPAERSKRMAEVVMDIRQVSPRRQNLLVETDRLGELSGAATRERVITKFEERIRQRPEVDSTNGPRFASAREELATSSVRNNATPDGSAY
jgi:hypothetical protein